MAEAGASTRVSSGEPASTTAGVRVTADGEPAATADAIRIMRQRMNGKERECAKPIRIAFRIADRCHSPRNARMGSQDAARRAGMNPAAAAESASTKAATTMVPASRGLILYSRLLRK